MLFPRKHLLILCLIISKNIYSNIDGQNGLVFENQYSFSNSELARGFIELKKGFSVASTDTVFLDINQPIEGEINLNGGGTIIMLGNLILGPSCSFGNNAGFIKTNGHRISVYGTLGLTRPLYFFDDDVIINGHSQGKIRMVNFIGALHFGQVQNVSLQNIEVFTTNPESRIYLPLTFLNDFELDGSILTFFGNTSFNTRANRFNILGDSKFRGRGATLTVTTNFEVNNNGNFEIGEFAQITVNDFRVGGVESIFTLNNLSTLEFIKTPTADVLGNGQFSINGQATFKGIGNTISTNANQNIILESGSKLTIENAHLILK